MQDQETTKKSTPPRSLKNYKIQFREKEQVFTASSRIQNLKIGEVVMIQTDHGLEPARIIGLAAQPGQDEAEIKPPYILQRRGTRDEIEKYYRLIEREKEATRFCLKQIAKHKLSMKLIRVERFFNGSKIIFYFTAENRVDFRQLVKDLVQQFRTRVEMRQIGVRHETKMVGGLGCCGRELCCSSFINTFAPVSIKMAKEQYLPLNPVKISGICNRLLCCLTYEFPTYHELRKVMPKPGKTLTIGDKTYKITQVNLLEEKVVVSDPENPDNPDMPMTLERKDWEPAMQQQRKERGPKPGRGRKKPPQKSEKKDKSSKGRQK